MPLFNPASAGGGQQTITAPADAVTTNGTLVFEELTARPSV